MMLPPIQKQVGAASGSAVELTKRRSSASSEFGAGLSLQANPIERQEVDHVVERHSPYLVDRLVALERENHLIREEMSYLRQTLSNNQNQRDGEKAPLNKVSEELQHVVHTFNAKVQADSLWQQREQQKAALLFAEVARLGHALDSLEHILRNLGDDTRRRLDHHDQQLSQLSLNSVSLVASRNSPTKRSQEEYNRYSEEVQWMKQAISQLRSELESDRNERWKVESERSQWAADLRSVVMKTEASMDARIASHLERVHSKLVTDKMEMVRALDEYRELMTGADFKRMSSQMIEFSRINDHLLALERWIYGEHGKIKRVLQTIQTEFENRMQMMVGECSASLRLLSTVIQQQDDDWQVQFGTIQEAVTEMAIHVQRKVFALEEVVPMEVRARQANDEKLRQRLESAVKSLSRALDSTRKEALTAIASSPPISFAPNDAGEKAMTATKLLQQRIQGLEEAQAQVIRQVEEKIVELEATKIPAEQRLVPIPATDTSPPATETATMKRDTDVLVPYQPKESENDSLTMWRDLLEHRASELSRSLMEEFTDRHNELLAKLEALEGDQGDAIAGLQRWSATHAQECRQCYEYFQWSLDQTATETAVRQTLDRLVDGVLWMTVGSGQHQW